MTSLLLALALLAAPPESKQPETADAGAGHFAALSPASVSPVTVKPGLRAKVLLTSASTGSSDVAVATLDFSAGTSVPLHRHAGAELLYVTRGQGEVAGGTGVATPVGPGQVIYAAPNAAHQFRAKTAMSLVTFYAPGGPELRFLGRADPGTRPATPEDSKADPPPAVFDLSKIAPLKILEGKGTVRIVIDQTNAPAAKVAFSLVELAPKARVPERVHARETEAFYYLEGEVEVTSDDTKMTVSAPMAVHVPPGARHGARVTSKTCLRVLQIYSPPGSVQHAGTPAD